MNILFFIISVLPVIIGMRLYEKFRTHYELTSGGAQKHYRFQYLAIRFFTVVFTVLGFAAAYFSPLVIVNWALAVAALSWMADDVTYSLYFGYNWRKPPNPEDRFVSGLLYWLCGNNMAEYRAAHWPVKITLFVSGIIIIISSCI